MIWNNIFIIFLFLKAITASIKFFIINKMLDIKQYENCN